ncbi:superoxide dismutase family protein [Aureimonas sp. AU12]|uniref:superoxide dismutase family protein n=1 Tax=Aureimonas sp. AU12 TaxID=1638161 RepID=UPI0007806DCA|nr:superoxide dismutase family protein [Aureimonas sp. AU12]
MNRVLASLAVLALASPALALPAAAQEPAPMRIELKGADGASHGTVTLTETPHGVLIDGDLTGMADGEYAFHFHETGLCEGNFDSAKGHHNPTNQEHGFLAANGPHAGDMANVYVTSGKARFQQFNPMVRLAGGDAPLRDADGTAVMVHGGVDDYSSQPSGDAGSRMACGVVFAAQ